MKEEYIDQTKARFSDAAWFEYLKGRAVLVLGQGGISSWVTLALARIGCALYTFDEDTVELVNIAGQVYGKSHVGKSKVDAMKEVCEYLCDRSAIIPHAERYIESSFTNPIVIAGFDNMASRKLAYEKWNLTFGNTPEAIFIDGRLLAEDYQVYAITPGRQKMYEQTLFLDSEVEDAPCSLKSTTHCSMGIASDIVSVLTNHAANIIFERKFGTSVREVPFSIIKSIPLYSYEVCFGETSPDASRQSMSEHEAFEPGALQSGT